MLLPLLMMTMIGLVAIIGWQWHSQRKINRSIQEIAREISAIIERGSAEKVLVPTGEKTLQQLLIQINRLLDGNQKASADYAKTKDSLRKMISNMSHDLKTPLTVILGYTEKLHQKHALSQEEEQQIISRLNDKVNHLIAFIHQFFDLVTIKSEDYEIPLSKLSLNEVCRQSMLECYDLLSSKPLQVELDIPERPLYILGNEQALHRILNKLISNAIRYGSDGGVIGLTVREEGEFAAVDVWDRGKGIAEVHQERVFDRLYTLDDARNPQFQGSGLGLSITKRLTEQMKGTICLTSTPFEKTTFTCKFKQWIS